MNQENNLELNRKNQVINIINDETQVEINNKNFINQKGIQIIENDLNTRPITKNDNIKSTKNLNVNIHQTNTHNNTNNNNKLTNLNSLIEDFPHGSLIGRVLGGEYFHIKNKLSYISNCSGPLFLKMNLHDLRLNPDGKLNIFISGADEIPFMSIEKKLGWDINSLSLGCSILKTESERLIFTFLNKMRLNSNLFAQQYLENIKLLSNATNSLYKSLFENKKFSKLLNMDPKLLEYAKKILKKEIEKHQNVNGNNLGNNNCGNLAMVNDINKNENSKTAEKLELLSKEISQFGEELTSNGYKHIKFFIKRHEDTKPLSVAIKLILDLKARDGILNNENNLIGLMTIKSPYLQKCFFTILILANLSNTDNEINIINKTQNLISETNRHQTETLITD